MSWEETEPSILHRPLFLWMSVFRDDRYSVMGRIFLKAKNGIGTQNLWKSIKA